MNLEHTILCLARAALPTAWLPEEGAVPVTWQRLLSELEGKRPWRWLERARAEDDPRWKQPIPYVLVSDPWGRLAAYRRAGGEARLHGRWSLGIGGHVERLDEGDDLAETLLACAHREVQEELQLLPLAMQFLGIVNEEKTPVGCVHWGLVFLAQTTETTDHSLDLGPVHWVRPGAASLPLERWSRLALTLLQHPRKPAITDTADPHPATSTQNQEDTP